MKVFKWSLSPLVNCRVLWQSDLLFIQMVSLNSELISFHKLKKNAITQTLLCKILIDYHTTIVQLFLLQCVKEKEIDFFNKVN